MQCRSLMNRNEYLRYERLLLEFAAGWRRHRIETELKR